MRRTLRIMVLAAGLVPAMAIADREPKVRPSPPVSPATYAVPPLTPDNTFNLQLSTGGPVVIQLRPDKAPKSVERIKTLTQRGFYNGLKFHRVIDGFMAQTGDPKGNGSGGSELPNIVAEFNDMPHVRGEVAMARAKEKDSANSQFFIMFSPNFQLDNNYSPIGRVVAGMQYVDAVERGEPPATPSTIVQAWVGATNQRPPAPQPAAAPPPPSLPTTLPTLPTAPPAVPSGGSPQR